MTTLTLQSWPPVRWNQGASSLRSKERGTWGNKETLGSVSFCYFSGQAPCPGNVLSCQLPAYLPLEYENLRDTVERRSFSPLFLHPGGGIGKWPVDRLYFSASWGQVWIFQLHSLLQALWNVWCFFEVLATSNGSLLMGGGCLVEGGHLSERDGPWKQVQLDLKFPPLLTR